MHGTQILQADFQIKLLQKAQQTLLGGNVKAWEKTTREDMCNTYKMFVNQLKAIENQINFSLVA